MTLQCGVCSRQFVGQGEQVLVSHIETNHGKYYVGDKGVLDKVGDGQDIVGTVMRQWGVVKGGGVGVKPSLAVSKLLKGEQSYPHCALTDAKYWRDICQKVAEIKQTEVKDLLSEHLRDFSKVWKICLPMERSFQLSKHNMSDSDSDD